MRVQKRRRIGSLPPPAVVEAFFQIDTNSAGERATSHDPEHVDRLGTWREVLQRALLVRVEVCTCQLSCCILEFSPVQLIQARDAAAKVSAGGRVIAKTPTKRPTSLPPSDPLGQPLISPRPIATASVAHSERSMLVDADTTSMGAHELIAFADQLWKEVSNELERAPT